jgi:hypothetical protein
MGGEHIIIAARKILLSIFFHIFKIENRLLSTSSNREPVAKRFARRYGADTTAVWAM